MSGAQGSQRDWRSDRFSYPIRILLAGNKEATEIERVREVFDIARREGMNKRWPDRFFDLVVQQL